MTTMPDRFPPAILALGPGAEYGFSGTQDGMSVEQLLVVGAILVPGNVVHVGDCVGADEDMANVARFRECRVVGHPPSKPDKRSFWKGYDVEHPPEPYLKRNHAMVVAGVSGLIATPKDFAPPSKSYRGEGTWWTIRDALRYGRDVFVVLPDGSFWTPVDLG